MKIAILSDIHSNKFALKSTLNFLQDKEIEKFIFLGDFFGYYPWADETFEMIEKLFPKSICILGNHDELIIRENYLVEKPEYWDVIIQNRNQLSAEALQWLKSLTSEKRITIDSIHFRLCHGTPENSLTGRFYPDNKFLYDWFPGKNEIVLMGHTHYPLLKRTKTNGLIVNPGSVGQPRDGILTSSFCIIDSVDVKFEFCRVPYNIEDTIKELEILNWYPRAIKALKK